MQPSSSRRQNCTFRLIAGATCRNAPLTGFAVCKYHLGPLTVANARDRIIEAISDEIGLDFTEVFEETRIVDETDSLGVVEVIMRVEEELSIEVPDQEVDRLQSVGDFINYVSKELQKENLAGRPPGTLLVGHEREDQLSERIVKRVILSGQFRRYYEVLELDEGEIIRLIGLVIGKRRIYHVTPVVAYKDEEKQLPECIHLFLLGKHNLFYFRLSSKSVKFEWTDLKNLKLTYNISLDNNKKISLITVESFREAGPYEKPRSAVGSPKGKTRYEESLHNVAFDFDGDEINGALKFLDQYLTNLEDET